MLSHRFSQAVCLCSSIWVVSFLLLGGKGKLISIGIGMIPPLVIAGATASGDRRNLIVPSNYNGDWNLYRGTMLLVVLPLLLKLAMIALEYAATKPGKVANHLGISTLPAIAISLLPVSRYSRILQTCGWTVPQAIHDIHVSLGWYSVWAGTLHVIFYTYVWWTKHEGSWRAFVPDLQCWVANPVEQETDPCPGCDCSRRIRYLTGAVIGLAFLAIVATSTHYMRRSYYAIFYRVHVVAAPLAIVFLYMHWSKTTMYISGGVIVYLASWVPNYLEQVWQKAPVRIQAIDRIPCDDQRDIVVLTIVASKYAVFSAGQFVKLYAPEVARVAHPFTVFAEPERDGTFQIMFRLSGPFTKKLGHAICDSLNESEDAAKLSPPTIYLDGFHGGVDRLHQMLHHDHVILVAGGIGITPMLALMSQLVADDAGSNATSPLSTVTLHWICRDPALIEYVKERYFDAWAEMAQHVTIRCVIYNTAATCSEGSEGEIPRAVERHLGYGPNQVGVPFESSILSNTPLPIRWRRFASMANVLIIGMSTLVVYVFYYNVPTKKDVLKALLPPLVLVACALFISIGMLWSRSSESGYQAVPLSDGVSGAVALKAKTSFNNKRSSDSGADCSWEVYHGRPLFTDITQTLENASYPGAFVCGPSSLTKKLYAHLEHSCCNVATKVAVYLEHFEM